MMGDPVSPASVPEEMIVSLRRLGLIRSQTPLFERLSGGVSSDIFKVRDGARTFVVKRALETLRVSAEWKVPIERNDFEYLWLKTVGRIIPGSVPKLLGHDTQAKLFAMEFLDPKRYPVWKSALLEGVANSGFAAEVGARLATVHAATAGEPALASDFATDHLFVMIRLDPYLSATAARHADLGAALQALAERTLSTKYALVHGDISPKNILCGPSGPIFLDAECAWFGDPAFDLAFCLNHLLLKCLWNRTATADYLACFTALYERYLDNVRWEAADCLEHRAAALLPSLLLARIDGKSPVEYVTGAHDRTMVRQFAVPLILHPPERLDQLRGDWAAAL
jgi:aminoglycoside phosphotransferase (APT) family kinase protein